MGGPVISQVQERDAREIPARASGLEPRSVQEISPRTVATRTAIVVEGASLRLGPGVGDVASALGDMPCGSGIAPRQRVLGLPNLTSLAGVGLTPPGFQLVPQRLLREGASVRQQRGQEERDYQPERHRLSGQAAAMTGCVKHGRVHSLADPAISNACCNRCFPRSMTSMCLQHATFITVLRFTREMAAILSRSKCPVRLAKTSLFLTETGKAGANAAFND